MPQLICTIPAPLNADYPYLGLYKNESAELTTGRVYFTAPTSDVYNGFYCRTWITNEEAEQVIKANPTG